MLKDNKFTITFPLDLEKSFNGKSKRHVYGIAATEDEDLAGEILVLKGCDINYFTKHGFFNSDHGKGPGQKVGVPSDLCKITDKALEVDGELFPPGWAPADDVVQLQEIFAKNPQYGRKLGFSVEGKTLRREGKLLTKSWVKDIAITTNPFNVNTWLELKKSLSDEVFCCGNCDESNPVPEKFCPAMKKKISELLADGKETDFLKKALEAGYQVGPGSTGGSALRPESLLHNLVTTQEPIKQEANGGNTEDQNIEAKLKKSKELKEKLLRMKARLQSRRSPLAKSLVNSTQPLTKDQAIAYVMLDHGYNYDSAKKIVEFTIRSQNYTLLDNN